jgi:hypothetical protein
MNTEKILLSACLIVTLMGMAAMAVHIGGTTGLTIALCGAGLGWIGFSEMKRKPGK